MKIEILYFAGCPTHKPTSALVDEVVEALGVNASIKNIDVLTEEQAAELAFLGSPSIRVDGVDIDPTAAGRTDFGRRCRVYPSESGLTGLPPRSWLEATIRGEALEVEASGQVEASCCGSSSCCDAEKAEPEVVLLVADWCPQCPAAKTYWGELSTELGFALTTLDIASAEGAALADEHNVRALPTALIGGDVLGAGVARPERTDIVAALNA